MDLDIREYLDQLLTSLGAWAPFAFIAIYAVVPSLFFPGTILTVVGGYFFGPLWGTIYSVIGASIGSSLAFLTGRYIAGEWVEKNSKGKLAKIRKGVEDDGWRFVAIMRLVPIFPFTILNHAFGLTKIPLLTYAISTMIFIIPTTFAYAYVGYVGHEAAQGSKDLILKSSLALAFLLLVSFVPRLIKRFKKRD